MYSCRSLSYSLYSSLTLCSFTYISEYTPCSHENILCNDLKKNITIYSLTPAKKSRKKKEKLMTTPKNDLHLNMMSLLLQDSYIRQPPIIMIYYQLWNSTFSLRTVPMTMFFWCLLCEICSLIACITDSCKHTRTHTPTVMKF